MTMDATKPDLQIPGLSPELSQAFLSDPDVVAVIKAYLTIPDAAVKRKLRRLVEEIAAPTRRAEKSPATGSSI